MTRQPRTNTQRPAPSRQISISWLLLLLALIPASGWAEEGQLAGFQRRSFVITNASVIVRPGELLEQASVVIKDGLIQAVGTKVTPPPDAEVIAGQGLFVYAGFIDGGSTLLLDPARKPTPVPGRKLDVTRYVLAATRPDNRRGLTPEYHAAENLKLDPSVLESLRQTGIVAVHVLPDAGLSSGLGSLVSTGGGTPRDSVMSAATFQEFCLKPLGGDDYPATLMGATAHLRQAFLDARHYAGHWKLYRQSDSLIQRPPVDPTLEALFNVADGQARPLFLANSRDEIHRALDFCEEQHVAPVIWGGREAFRCLDRLSRQKTDLIVQLDFGESPKITQPSTEKKLTADIKDPVRVQEDRRVQWLDRVRGLSDLHQKSLRFAVTSHGLKQPPELLESLRTAMKQGLPREAALAALTTHPAAMLRASDRLGTLEAGKLGSVVVLTKPFDHAEAKVRFLFVDGQRFEYHRDEKPSPAQPPKLASQPPTEPDSKDPKETAAEKNPLLGQWNVTIKSAADSIPATLELTADEDNVKKFGGTFRSREGNGSITSGRLNEARVNFEVRLGKTEDGAALLKFSGELKDDLLAGEMEAPFGGTSHWQAARNTSGKIVPLRPAIAERHNADELPTELDTDRLARPFQTGGNVLIQNATVLTGTGQTLPETSILIQQGRIAAIGKDLTPAPGMKVIDATGRFVMPGIIDTHSHVMISQGINESTRSIVPEVRIKDVINTEDVSEYRALAGGVTAARLFHGSANVIGGQDAVVKLKYGKTAKEHVLHDAPQGVKFALGENVKYRTTRFPNTRLGVEATLNRAFMEALDYRRQWTEYEKTHAKKAPLLPPRRDLRLEALADIVNHQKFIHSHCYRADEILMLLRVASDLGVRVWSLQHVLEGYKIAPEILAHHASCSTFADWWAYKIEAYDATPYNAALLQEAGVDVVIKSDDPELIRHLYLEAAKTVRYGNVPPEEAVKMITLNAARQLGLGDRLGSIEVGKEADLAIYNGHPLSAFARCEQTLIEGEVYFSRAEAPTAMSAAAKERSTAAPPLVFPSLEIRQRELDLEPASDGRYALIGATLHPVDGPMIPEGTVLIEDGRIVALGTNVKIPTGTKTIDCAGLHVAPGFIDAGTQLGLVEIDKVRETLDFAEGGQYQPDLRAGVGLNVDSELIPVARSGGITSILIRPSGGVISGQASIAQLSGWTAPEMVQEYEAGLQVQWPSGKKQQTELRELLEEARLYLRLRTEAAKNNRLGPISDPRLEALGPYVSREKPVFMEADSRKAIAEALLFAEKENLRIIITGGTDAWKLADELKEREIPVIVGAVMRSPTSGFDPSDAPYANAGRLFEAGVKFCIRSNDAANSRNVPFEAAMAVAYGLPEDQGLRAVTLSAAEILGLEDRVGSLTPSKTANLVILDGGPLQHTSQIKGTFVAGRPFAPDSRQIRFYKRYRERLLEVQAQQKQTPSAEPAKSIAE